MAFIQDSLTDNFCWGCGADNPDGLQLKSEWDGSVAVARFVADPRYVAGPRHVLNGGIIATLLDCHGVCAAIAEAYRRAGRAIGSAPEIWHATTSMDVRYLRPTPIDAELVLRGTITEVTDAGIAVDCVLEAGGKERARALVTSIQVPDSWRHAGG